MLLARMQRWLLPVLWPVLAVSLRLAPPASRAPAPMLSVPGSSLRSTFEAALVLQRAGDADAALERYELFLQAARSLGTQVPPESFAEVLVNMGTIHAKRGDVSRAKQLFSEALDAREMGTAHLNLALLELSAASRGGGMPPSALSKARGHCERAIALNDDDNAVIGARRVLRDIERSKTS